MKTPGLRIALSLLLLSTLVLFGLIPGVAGAAGYGPVRSMMEYKLNEESGSPEGICAGPDGAMWFGEGSKIGRITQSGAIKEFQCPDTGGYVSDITTGPDGALWFCEASPQDPRSRGNRLGRITTSGVVTMFDGLPGFHSLKSITTGPDGALWFTDGGACKIGRITTAGVVTEFDDPDGYSPLDITAGPDGALWFTDINRICRITTAGHITQHALPGDPTSTTATGICVGPDGALWFTVSQEQYGPGPGPGPEGTSSQVGRMTTAAALTEYDIPSPNMWLGDIAPGADGALWFTETKYDEEMGTVIDNMGRMTTTGAFTEFCTPSASYSLRISQGPAGTIWVTENTDERFGTIAKLLVYPPVPPPTQWKSTAYFAEGYTGTGFQEYVCIQNPNAAPADAWLTWMASDGSSDTQYLTLAPTSRMTVDVNQLAGAGKELSARVVSTSPGLVVERPMYFNYEGKWTGGHDVMGVTTPATTFYFAEGTCRPNFDTYFCIQNPGDVAANVRLTYMKGDGTTALESFAVKPHSRFTVIPKDKLGEGEDPAHDFSTMVECTNWQPIVCERPTYFNYRGAWTGGHDVTGVSAPASGYLFAEGTCRPDFDPYFCIFNPGNKDAAVTVSLETGDYGTKAHKLTVGRHSRATVRVKDLIGEGDDRAHDFSTEVACTNGQKIVCERPMYFNYKDNWTGGSDVMGATHLSKKFYFAEGSSRQAIDQYFSVWNPTDEPIGVKIAYMFTDGSVLEQTQDVEARATVDCRAFLAGAGKLGSDFSATVTNFMGKDFLIERPMYFDFNGWTGGHDVIGYTGAN